MVNLWWIFEKSMSCHFFLFFPKVAEKHREIRYNEIRILLLYTIYKEEIVFYESKMKTFFFTEEILGSSRGPDCGSHCHYRSRSISFLPSAWYRRESFRYSEELFFLYHFTGLWKDVQSCGCRGCLQRWFYFKKSEHLRRNRLFQCQSKDQIRRNRQRFLFGYFDNTCRRNFLW